MNSHIRYTFIYKAINFYFDTYISFDRKLLYDDNFQHFTIHKMLSKELTLEPYKIIQIKKIP